MTSVIRPGALVRGHEHSSPRPIEPTGSPAQDVERGAVRGRSIDAAAVR
ncbi:MAG: hypothetical protein M3P31_06265 [Actinomycetota bacterium]|nr:hypothetical protein [Actinomycetota bacterium]